MAADEVFERVKNDYLEQLLLEIRRSAEVEASGEELRSKHVFRAFENRFAGIQRRSPGEWVQDNLFLFLGVFLTIVFGAFGLYHPDEGEVSGFLDIAKIFAGAVVGGAATSTAEAWRSNAT